MNITLIIIGSAIGLSLGAFAFRYLQLKDERKQRKALENIIKYGYATKVKHVLASIEEDYKDKEA